jgi:hypothetical protein
LLPEAIGRLGLASSYGVGEREVAIAFERGVRFFFWGALRRSSFGAGLKRLGAAPGGERAFVAVQSFAKQSFLLGPSVEIARRRLGRDRIDVFCLAYHNARLDPAMLDAAKALVDRGVVGSLAVSSHDRPTLVSLASEPALGTLMVRYNAGHRGAEEAVFPAARQNEKSILAYTATRWGSLLDPKSMRPGEHVPRASDCYRFVLSHPAVTACLFGPANEAEMIEALTALERGPMSESELAVMRRIGDHVHEHRMRAPPLGAGDYARGILRSIRDHGLTEDLLSRFNR